MAEEKKNPHCLHVCEHIEAMMEEAADKKFEEKMQANKPVSCSTGEDSNQLHELYKDKVKRTEPSEEKAQMMKDLMEAIEHAQLVHSMTLLRVKQEETGLKRHPSTLSHMNHDDSDSEPDVEEYGPEQEATGCMDIDEANLTTDQVRSSTVEDTEDSDGVKQDEAVPKDSDNKPEAEDKRPEQEAPGSTDPAHTNPITDHIQSSTFDNTTVSDGVKQDDAVPQEEISIVITDSSNDHKDDL